MEQYIPESELTDASAVCSRPMVIRNEFACVGVRMRDPGGRPRLRIEDLRTRQVIELDAIELETLAWSRHDDLAPLLDPSNARWTDLPGTRNGRSG